jgi:hypothetical protein
MNYTYLASSPYTSTPDIIMTTDPSSRKALNLISDPHISLLVHDWVSHHPPITNRRSSTTNNERTGSPPPEASRSSLVALRLNQNTSALSSISATINGEARLGERGTEEAYLREKHLDNNKLADEEDQEGQGSFWDDRERQGGGRDMYIEGKEVRVVVVKITDGRVSDWKGGVRD